jgi:hypothetical protein
MDRGCTEKAKTFDSACVLALAQQHNSQDHESFSEALQPQSVSCCELYTYNHHSLLLHQSWGNETRNYAHNHI